MLLIVKDLGFEHDTIKQELIVSITLVGCIVASIGSRDLTDRCGRRPSILVASFTFTIGAVIMWVARATQYPFYMLLVGRFIVGLGVGLASMVTPLYISEVCSTTVCGVDASRRSHGATRTCLRRSRLPASVAAW